MIEEVAPEELPSDAFPLTDIRVRMRDYYAAIWQGGFRDSLLVGLVGDGPACAAVSDDAHGLISFFERPVELELSTEPHDATGSLELARRKLAEELIARAEDHQMPLIASIPEGSGSMLAPAGRELLSRGAQAEPDFRGRVDLVQSEEVLFKTLRKSTRQRVRRSRSILEPGTEIIDSLSPVDARMAELREFHLEVAGRVTRPEESWKVMAEEIRDGFAEAIFCRLDGRLVAATFVRLGKWVAEAGTSVYARDRFDLPLGHWPKWLSIMRAKEHGLSRYMLYGIYPDPKDSSQKLRRIGEFKRGFASDVEVAMNFHLVPSADPQS